jgi:hypothetical protein
MTDEKPKRSGRPPRPTPSERLHVYMSKHAADFIRDYAKARNITLGEVIERLVQLAH